MPDVLTAPCSVGRTIKVDSSCGCTLTKPIITGFGPDDIVALGYKEVYLTQAILDAKEAKMLGVKERGLQDLLTSTIKDIKGDLVTQRIDEQSIIQPFIMRTQRTQVNANYFSIEGGVAPGDAGVGAIPASAWDFTINLGPSWLKTNIEAIERYFLPGSTLIVLTWDSSTTKVAKTLVFTIIRSVNADAGSTPKARVTVSPPVNSTAWASLSTPEKAAYHPTFGVAQTGTNSVNDYESYCPVQPSNLNKKIVTNWLQDSRESYCREQAYEEVLDAILGGKVNDYLKGFKSLSIQEQQKQQAARNRQEWYNSVFWGQAIDINNQTEANWRNLPQVFDPINSTCPLAYKANALGIFTQLMNCNRVIDMAGNKLSLDFLFQQLYYLRRTRESGGDSVPVIDSLTDRYTANMILEVMSKYYHKRYDFTTTQYMKSNEKITHDNVVLFNYNIYDIPDASVQWAVFVDDYFNDMIDAFNTAIVGWDFRTRARNLWFIDWSDISIGVAGTNQATRKQPDPNTNALFQCVISANVRTYDLRSKKWTVFVDRAERHLIIHNFADQCAQITAGYGCVVPQS